MPNKDIASMAQAMAGELVQIRRDLHRWPELSFQESKTSAYIQKKLSEYGIEFQAGVAGTGVIALIRGGKQGKTILIRADMDALPILEQNPAPYRSQNEGVMHACGHDAHVACLLGAAKILKAIAGELCGNVKLMFQPGEETTGGALPMINEGLLEDPAVDAAIALHVESSFDCGKIVLKPGPVMASPDEFNITIKGKGGHGALPHKAVDPILTGAKIVEAVQSISARSIEATEPVVVSVCGFSAGSSYNIIPDTAKLVGTARSVCGETRKKLKALLERIVSGICMAMGAEYELDYRYMFPPLINDEAMIKLVETVAQDLYGQDSVVHLRAPFMGGDDFAYVAEKVPASYFHLGCGNKQKGITHPWHSSSFDIDEDCLPVGAGILAAAAAEYLGRKG